MYNDLLRFVVMQDRDWDFRTLDVSQNIPPRESLNYYNGLVKTMDKEKVDGPSGCSW